MSEKPVRKKVLKKVAKKAVKKPISKPAAKRVGTGIAKAPAVSKAKTKKIKVKPKSRSVRRSGAPRARTSTVTREAKTISSDTSVTFTTSHGTRASSHEKRQVGLSLKFKFALPICGFIAVLVLAWAFISSSRLEDNLINQIKLDGANGAQLLGLFAKDVIESHAHSFVAPAEIEGEEAKEMFKKFQTEFLNKRKDWLAPLTQYPIVSSEPMQNHIMDILITNDSGKVILASAQKSVSLKKRRDLSIEINGRAYDIDEKKISVATGQYTSGGQSFPFYQFTSKVYDDDKKEIGKAIVLLSAVIIGETKRKMLMGSLVVGLVAVIVGSIIAILLAGAVTKPIESLTRDVKIVAGGNLSHKTVPRSNDEVGLLAYEFAQMTKAMRRAQDREIEQHRLEHELSIATDIQKSLLPRGIPKVPGLDFSALYFPAKEVGGDYYDYIPIGTESIALAVADVSGKGVPGSMVMTQTRMLLRMESRTSTSPADTLKKINKTLSQEIRKGMFVTAMYCVLNVRTKSMTVCSAGHNPLLVYRKATGKIEQFNPNGIALGFDRGTIFDRTIKEVTVSLNKEDVAVLYTDGVVEAMNIRKEEYGDDRFIDLILDLVGGTAKEIANGIYADLEAFRGKAEQHDDITISIVKAG